MEYALWAPHYAQIARDLGFPFEREIRCAGRLEELLPLAAREDPLGRIARRVRGHEVVVVGLAPRAGPPPIWRLPSAERALAILAADGAAATCIDAGIVPNVIVTDLDGPIAAEVSANRRGALTVVHAHGDNLPAIEEWVPQFPGEMAGSWAGAPRPTLLDVGGFTDGDRAVFLAEHTGAKRILLWGFDFDSTDDGPPVDRHRKLAKLAWARRSISLLAKASHVPIETWRRDGSFAPYDGGSKVESTR